MGKWMAALVGSLLVAAAAAPATALTVAVESNVLKGSVTYDPAATTCPSACPVTSLVLRTLNPQGVIDSYAFFADVIGLATVDLTTAPDSLNAVVTIHDNNFFPATSTLFAGFFSPQGPGTFQRVPRRGAPINGTLSLAPLPAGLPLLAAALAGLGLVRRRAVGAAAMRPFAQADAAVYAGVRRSRTSA